MQILRTSSLASRPVSILLQPSPLHLKRKTEEEWLQDRTITRIIFALAETDLRVEAWIGPEGYVTLLPGNGNSGLDILN